MSRAIAEDLKKLSIYRMRELDLLKPLMPIYNQDTLVDSFNRQGVLNWYEREIIIGSIGYKIYFTGNRPVTINLAYTINNEVNIDYTLKIEQTVCNYGGFRYWLKCYRCEQRAANLYLYEGYFICRHCANLTYSDNNNTKRYREIGQALGSVRVQKLEDHLDKTNRYYYGGRLTKKAKRLEQLTGYQEAYARQTISKYPILNDEL